ncbi:MAG: hypothetical protein LBI28_07430 [Treponema sp.]|jgi:hypothetical protein|nr:hypothetical protein [Treponema sp.]
MKNKNFSLKIPVMILALGFMAVWSLPAQTDSRLNGRWSGVVLEGMDSELTMNNGNYEVANNGVSDTRGTYTTNNGQLTMKPTHVFGGAVNEAAGFSMLESKWYTTSEFVTAIRTVFLGLGLPEEVINEVVQLMTSPPSSSYSINANTLTLSYIIDGESIEVTYTKR